jgi:hypothetical protein
MEGASISDQASKAAVCSGVVLIVPESTRSAEGGKK